MSQRNLELDRLRAYAVIMVMLTHADNFDLSYTLKHIFSGMWLGVDLFFVISGYIISKTIVQKLDSLKGIGSSQLHYIKAFFIRRIFRIYPVALCVFIFILACSFFYNLHDASEFPSLDETAKSGIAILFSYFNYYHTIVKHSNCLGPYWSLSIEEQFYLLFPLFLLLIPSNKLRVFILMILLLLITFYIRPYVHPAHVDIDFIKFLTPFRCDGLIYGCLIYFATEHPWAHHISSGKRLNKNLLIGITSALIILIALLPSILTRGNITLAIPMASVLSSLLVICASLENGMIASYSFIESGLDYVGQRSYSLYLTHLPMYALAKQIVYRPDIAGLYNHRHILTFSCLILALALTLISTKYLHQFIEKPFIRVGRELSSRLTHSPVLKNGSDIKSSSVTEILLSNSRDA